MGLNGWQPPEQGGGGAHRSTADCEAVTLRRVRVGGSRQVPATELVGSRRQSNHRSTRAPPVPDRERVEPLLAVNAAGGPPGGRPDPREAGFEPIMETIEANSRAGHYPESGTVQVTLTVDELSDHDPAYAPPFNTTWDPVPTAAKVVGDRRRRGPLEQLCSTERTVTTGKPAVPPPETARPFVTHRSAASPVSRRPLRSERVPCSGLDPTGVVSTSGRSAVREGVLVRIFQRSSE